MNAYLKRFLKEKMHLFEFVRSFQLAISGLRHATAYTISNTKNSIVVLFIDIIDFEKHALESYTRNVFHMVIKELESKVYTLRWIRFNEQTLLNICLPSIAHSIDELDSASF